MNVRARMLCHHVDRWSTHEVVHLQAVYSQDKDSPNYSYSQATPSAELKMTITNPAAFGAFLPGVEYDLPFSPVPKPAEPS